MGVRVPLEVGATILFPEGVRIVVAVGPMHYVTRDVEGVERSVAWEAVTPARPVVAGRVDAVAESLAPVLYGLTRQALAQALDRLEVVHILETGYANGHPALAREGEPYTAFGPHSGFSLTKQYELMAKLITRESQEDRHRQRDREDGDRSSRRGRLGPVATSSVRNWHERYKADVNGRLVGLVDGRRKRSHRSFASLDPELKRVAEAVSDRQDGTWSTRSIDELYRRTVLQLKTEGLHELHVPEATLRSYLSHLRSQRGATTRSNTTRVLRGVLSVSAYPALRPGQVVAIDVTRADTFVVDPWSGKPISVEIITALDICTRVVLALRVVPRSATSLDAALILYDVLRPFSQNVEAGRAHDWRWAGVPESVGLMPDALVEAERLGGRPLLGEHAIPGLLPDAVRTDKGSMFTSRYFRAICDNLGVHLLLSRGKKPTDNAFVERWHETLQRCLQQLAGHKGRNVAQRGSNAGKIVYDKKGRAHFMGDGPGLTPRELEVRLREFVATDYHRTRHEGLVVVDRHVADPSPGAGLTPLECFDAILAATGRLHVLQQPGLLYDLLPVRWLTIRHDGAEYKNLTYDTKALGEFRHVPKGFFRDQDRAAPFFYDPRDVSRLWFCHPDTGVVIEVPWRRAFQLQAPMTKEILKAADTARKRRHATGATISKKAIQAEILHLVNDISDVERLRADPALSDWAPTLTAAPLRASRSQFDHAEAAASAATRATGTRRRGEAGSSRAAVPVAGAAENGAEQEFDTGAVAWPALDLTRGER